jgi:GT2 family glycosyltransferase
MLYPRPLLEQLGGFDPAVLTGEDCDLMMRATAAGAEVVAAPEAIVWHAVHTPGIGDALRDAWRWRFMARLVRRHPQLRRRLVLGVFWKRSHALFGLAGLGVIVALARRSRWPLLLAAPWVRERLPVAESPAGYARATAELPVLAVVDAVEMAALAGGSIQARTVIL